MGIDSVTAPPHNNDNHSMETNGKVAVIGCGLIGSCWGALFASAGYSVSIYEVNESAVEAGIGRIKENLIKLEKECLQRGNLTTQQALRNVSGTTDLEKALEGAMYAQESTVEDESFKKNIFEAMENCAPEDTILASSTSTIPSSRFTEHLRTRSRCLVVHPVNPPLYLPLTEIVPSPWTQDTVVERASQIMKSIGQKPVHLKKEVLGFAVNRIQYALLAESWNLVKNGVLSPEDVDTVMSEGLGPRYAFYGPLQVIHMNANGVEDYCKRYAAGIRKVLEDFSPNPTFDEEEVIEQISNSMKHKVPDLPTAVKERESKLAQLQKLKLKID